MNKDLQKEMENKNEQFTHSHLNLPQNGVEVPFTNVLQISTNLDQIPVEISQQTEYITDEEQINEENVSKIPFSTCWIILFFISIVMVSVIEVLILKSLIITDEPWLCITFSLVCIFVFLLTIFSFLFSSRNFFLFFAVCFFKFNFYLIIYFLFIIYKSSTLLIYSKLLFKIKLNIYLNTYFNMIF